MSTNGSKTKEERLLEIYIKEYITENEFYAMLKQIRKIKGDVYVERI